jgi:hypothetical protein
LRGGGQIRHPVIGRPQSRLRDGVVIPLAERIQFCALAVWRR